MLFFSKEEMFGGLLDNSSLGDAHQKEQARIKTWNFQSYPWSFRGGQMGSVVELTINLAYAMKPSEKSLK